MFRRAVIGSVIITHLIVAPTLTILLIVKHSLDDPSPQPARIHPLPQQASPYFESYRPQENQPITAVVHARRSESQDLLSTLFASPQKYRRTYRVSSLNPSQFSLWGLRSGDLIEEINGQTTIPLRGSHPFVDQDLSIDIEFFRDHRKRRIVVFLPRENEHNHQSPVQEMISFRD